MVAIGRTKRKRGDIWAQLGVSACVLLLPPLGMTAGVMYLGSSQRPDGGQPVAAQQAAAPQATVAEVGDAPSGAGTSFSLASTEQHPVIPEQGTASATPGAAARPITQLPVASPQQAPTGQAAGTKNSARYSGPAPVTLVHVEEAGQRSATAEAAPPVEKADAPAANAAVPQDPAEARQPSHAARRTRHEARNTSRVRQGHIPSLSEIFGRAR